MTQKPLTTGDVAKYCHVTPIGVKKWIRSGKLKAYRTPGGHYRINRDDFRGFLGRYRMPINEGFFSPGHHRILVVDDEPAFVDFIMQALSEDNLHFKFATAGDGFEAGVQVEAFRPDLIILEIMMPNIDGLEVCRRIKSDAATRHIKVLAITGFYYLNDNIQKMKKAGADRCLAKPIDPAELRSQVRTLLGLNRRREDL